MRARTKIKESGIYKLTNIINGKIYVGESTDLYLRKHQHQYCLDNNCHTNLHLRNSVAKHGKDNFVFSVIEYCPPEALREREIYWILYLKSTNSEYGYNKSVGRDLTTLLKEVRDRIRASLKGRKRPEVGIKTGESLRNGYKNGRLKVWNKGLTLTDEQKKPFKECSKGIPRIKNREPVCLYELDGVTLIKCFESIRQAVEQTGTPLSSLMFNLRGRRKKTKTGIWKYNNEKN